MTGPLGKTALHLMFVWEILRLVAGVDDGRDDALALTNIFLSSSVIMVAYVCIVANS